MRFKNRYVLMNAAGEGDGSGSESAIKPDTSVEQIETLTRSVGLLAESLKAMEGNQNQIVATLAKITEQSKGEVKDDLKASFGSGVDLEQLDRKDFAKFILEHTDKVTQDSMTALLSKFEEKINDLGSRFESKNANEQIEKTASANKDFWEWSSEIKTLLKDNPTLSVSRAYALARAENTDKAKTLDSKYRPTEERKAVGFIGLTPTSSLNTREGIGKMTQKEAASKAFDSIMSDLGDIKNGDLKLA